MKSFFVFLFAVTASLAWAGEAKLQFDANNTHGAVEFFAQRKPAALEWGDTPVEVVSGLGEVLSRTERDSGTITATQTGNTITLSSGFLVATDVGKVLEWDSGTTTTIAHVSNPTTAIGAENRNQQAGLFKIATDRIQLVDQTVLPGTWTYRVAARTLSGDSVSTFSNDAETEIAPFGPGSLQVVSLSGLSNLSARAKVGKDANILIGGLVTRDKTRILARGVGPGLNRFNLPGVLLDPTLTFYDKSGAVIASNNDWGNDPEIAQAAREVFAFALSPDSKDAAMLLTLDKGQFTMHLNGANQTEGVALLEIYEVY